MTTTLRTKAKFYEISSTYYNVENVGFNIIYLILLSCICACLLIALEPWLGLSFNLKASLSEGWLCSATHIRKL